jgi:hypothetical protein
MNPVELDPQSYTPSCGNNSVSTSYFIRTNNLSSCIPIEMITCQLGFQNINTGVLSSTRGDSPQQTHTSCASMHVQRMLVLNLSTHASFPVDNMH